MGPTIPPVAPDVGARGFFAPTARAPVTAAASRAFEALSAEPFGVSWLPGTGDFLASSVRGLAAGTREKRDVG